METWDGPRLMKDANYSEYRERWAVPQSAFLKGNSRQNETQGLFVNLPKANFRLKA